VLGQVQPHRAALGSRWPERLSINHQWQVLRQTQLQESNGTSAGIHSDLFLLTLVDALLSTHCR
jgi:hypothetical protein